MRSIRLIPALMVVLSAVSLSLTSCVRETMTGNQSPLSFVESASQTRATQTGTFENGDAIGIFMCKKGSTTPYAVNKQYVYTNGIFRPASTSDILLNGGDELYIYAYYPYDVNNTRIDAVASMVKSQATEADWKKSDFLTAFHKGRITDDIVPLHFLHRYATVEVTVIDPGDVSSLLLRGIKYRSLCNLTKSAGGMSVLNETKDIALFRASGNPRTFRCTVPANAVFGTDNLELRYPDGHIYKFTAAQVQLQEGRIHRFTADMGEKEIKPVFRTDPESDVTITAGPEAGSKTVVIISQKRYRKGGQPRQDKLSYRIKGSSPWIHATQDAKGNLSISWDENKAAGSRTGTVTIEQSETGTQLVISVVQSSASYEFHFGDGSILYTYNGVSSNGESLSLPVIISMKHFSISGVKHDVKIDYTPHVDAPWLKLSEGKIIVEESKLTSIRTGSITFTQKESNKVIVVKIKQKKKNKVDIND